MRTIYFHVGYHKTATTFLQRFIYPKLKNVNYIRQRDTLKQLTKIRLNKLSDLKIENYRDYFNSFNNRKPMVFSYEGLSGSPFAPKKVKTQFSILKDIRRIFPASDYDVHIIVGIREQVSLLTALYVQHVHQGGTMDAEQFIKYSIHNGSIENYHYQEYLKMVEDLFGRDHLYLMVFEQFKQDSERELKKLLHYLGEPRIPRYKTKNDVFDMNKSYGTFQVAAARKLNHFFKTPIHRKGRFALIKVPDRRKLPTRKWLQNRLSYSLHYKKYKFPVELRDTLKQRYLEGNKELAENYAMDLPDVYL